MELGEDGWWMVDGGEQWTGRIVRGGGASVRSVTVTTHSPTSISHQSHQIILRRGVTLYCTWFAMIELRLTQQKNQTNRSMHMC